MEWLTTTTMLDRLRDASDESIWSRFVERFRAPITGFARKLGLGASDAEDVAQETMLAFLESYRKSTYERGRGRLSHYLFGIAHNKILMAQRKIAARDAQVAGSGDGTTFWQTVPDPDALQQTWDLEWRQAVLAQGVEQVRREVTAQTFEAFRMVVFEHVEPAIAATRLGMTRNAVFIAKHRVGTRLRELCTAYDEDR